MSAQKQTLVTPESFATFGELLRYLRRRARLTQGELAAAVGYSREQITKLENNQRAPDLTMLKARFIPALDLDAPGFANAGAWGNRLLSLASAARPQIPEPDASPRSSPAMPATNLRDRLTSFIGRERELAEIDRLLHRTRLLVLIGAGGVGKTRLALQAGGRVLSRFSGGVWWVDLSALTAPHLPEAVAAAIGVPTFSRDIDTALVDHLRVKSVLLIFDNCEHLIDECTRLAELLLHECPALSILVTSRTAMNTLAAVTWRVPSLAQSDAAELFAERAAASRVDFQSSAAANDTALIQHLCARLDGIPLAIELAATRVRTLSVEQIADRLSDRFRLLNSGNGTAPARQQTLRAAMDWSYDLLSDAEQTLLRGLSVFVGGCTLEAVEIVTGNADALDLLTQLHDKSLIDAEEHVEGTRYVWLETVQEYALEKRNALGESEALRTRHLAYFGDFAETAERGLATPRQPIWTRLLLAELENLRAALDYAIHGGDLSSGSRIFVALWIFWFWRGVWKENLAWAGSLIGHPGFGQIDARLQGRTLIAAASFAGRMGEYSLADQWLAAGERLASAVADREYLAWVWINRCIAVPDHHLALELIDRSLTAFRLLNLQWQTANGLFVLGDRARAAGDTLRAAAAYRESVAIFRALGDHSLIAYSIGNLGRIALETGQNDDARAAFEESLSILRESGSQLGIADWLIQLAVVTLRQRDDQAFRAAIGEALPALRDIGNYEAVADCLILTAEFTALTQPDGAARLIGAVSRILDQYHELHGVLELSGAQTMARLTSALREQLSASAFHSAWDAGQTLSFSDAVTAGLALLIPHM